MSGFEHGCLFSNSLEGRVFAPGMRTCGGDFYICDGHALRLTAVGGWAGCWLYRGV